LCLWTAHSQQLADHEFRPRGKHYPDQADYDIETGIFKRKRLGVTFNETSLESFRIGTGPRTLHQIRRDVYTGDVHSIRAAHSAT